MSKRLGYLAIAVLAASIAGCADSSIEIGSIEPADYVEQDLTRWAQLPYASLPPPRFIRVREEGRYNPTGGTPNLAQTIEREIAATNGAFSTMRVKVTGKGRRPLGMFRGFMGYHSMSSTYTGGWGEGTRQILEVVPGRSLPVNPVVKSRFPELQGVRAADLSYEFTWKIRIGQGVGSERWFTVSSIVTDVAETGLTVNGAEYLIDAYLIDYSVNFEDYIYKQEVKMWYVPVLGWHSQYDQHHESRRGSANSVIDKTSFEVSDEVLTEFRRYAKPIGS